MTARDGEPVTASETIATREGETVDVDALRTWLQRAVPSLMPADATLRVAQFPSGFSNLTYKVEVEGAQGSHSYVLRRPPRGARPGVAHDMRREHDILCVLHELTIPVPAPVARCDDESVIGAPFYLMQHVDGIILRGARPPEVGADAATRQERLWGLSSSFVMTLSELHDVDVALPSLHALQRPGDYVERQVGGWTKRWRDSQTRPLSAVNETAAWLERNRPPAKGASLVHNDFKFDNLVLDRRDPTRIVAILDWEMATVGDPLMDLGTSLAYWVEAKDPPIFRALGLGVTALPGSAKRDELVGMYAAATKRDTSNVAFYYAFGLFKVAVIAQQIYARYVQGLTADPRFEMLGAVVEALGEQAHRVTVSREL
jgi:aminoglycoside phosphotransferase (APT) family kinase protein